MKTQKLEINMQDPNTIILTNEVGDTFTSKSEDFNDFISRSKSEEDIGKQPGIYVREQLVQCWIEGQSFLEGKSNFETIDDFIESITKKSVRGNVLIDQSEQEEGLAKTGTADMRTAEDCTRNCGHSEGGKDAV
jgi:hypothetical protein